jgi:aryl-alcohol dehydrogenase-like predicted oxidoreductase
MAGFPERVTLGRSGLTVGPLGVAGGYGVEAAAIRRAVDRGCTYLYHGSRREQGMRSAIRELKAAGRRDELVVVLQSYSRWPWLLERMLARGLRALGIDHADVLLLGWYNDTPPAGLLERVMRLQEKGLFRHLAVSGHRRPSFVDFTADPRYAILHIRYNAGHPGAEQDVFPHLPTEGRPGAVAFTATRWGSLLSARRMPPGESPLRGRDAYRFVLSNPDFNVCMSGPKNAAELEEALAALDEGPLSAEEMARVRRIGEHVRAHGWIG